MQKKTLFIVLGLVVGGLGLCGCCGVGGFFFALPRIREAAERQQSATDLRQISVAMLNFYDVNKRMPAKAEDLDRFLEGGPVMQRLRKGEIEVVWNALPAHQQPGGRGNVVYAWDTKVFSGGVRNVLYMDGVVEAISESEFQQKAKAQTSK